ncbi:Phage integrase family protein [Lysobacter silvestris]|uniref:Phage integrase family protein n=2 Tax=Solilutibacter silvestris TaxID=1645665 RepID=A0A2K1PXD3_9GAMM|nr:tyrosine-type recombinase/integrase [Lysobacter silvestris]PNS07337.1 Phage integrase family protein [Lysobacter silvestris]
MPPSLHRDADARYDRSPQVTLSRLDRNRLQHDVPVSLWPDGTVCWPTTLYLNVQFREGKSTRTRGGTLGTYAKQLGHLLRVCYQLRCDFRQIDDVIFGQWIHELGAEQAVNSQGRANRARSANQVNAIGRRALHFLLWFQSTLAPGAGLIGQCGEGCRITVEFKTFIKDGRSYRYVHHSSFPHRDAVRRRTPVTGDQIERMFAANLASTQSAYVKRRRSTMMHLALALGSRRFELATVTVKQVRDAKETGLIAVQVVKTKKRKIREIPVVRSRLEPILGFVDGHRSKLIRSTVGVSGDTGHLFLTSQGKPLSENTLTNDMHDLATLAKLEVRACLHMFRHRYFTDMAYNFLLGVREFAERGELTVPSELIVLQEMRNLSQHASDASLVRYIHSAYREASAWSSSEGHWRMSQLQRSMSDCLVELDGQLLEGSISSSRAKALLQHWIALWKNELTAIVSEPDSDR